MKYLLTPILVMLLLTVQAQEYWQQRADYTIDVQLDVTTHRVTGHERIQYTNASPDTLRKVYFHLYFNAFQPGSMMDVRSRNIMDPDPRVRDRISKLKPEEIGYQKVTKILHENKTLNFKVSGTIMEVTLEKALLPGSKTTFELDFESQVPLQIRRSGRNNREGISYTMTQWYPKLAEYDHQGWHPYNYVAREFHAPFGDYKVKITLNSSYVVAGTGKVVNAEKVGHGYQKQGAGKNQEGNLTWEFQASNVIDFAWAADPDYQHDIMKVPDGPELHFFYQPKSAENWKKMEPLAVKHFEFMNKTFGKYPYESYSIIQGGDGGMEYPMCTMILGDGSLDGLVGVMIHEASHSWFQGVLASNEALYPWLDEGFTDFASNESQAALFNESNPHEGSYNGYFSLVRSGYQEPISQHSDHYSTNRAYSTAAYSMGTVLLHQLKYIIGNETFYRGMKRYYQTWKFRHPGPNDFIRIMEKESGMQLKWYLSYWVNTTKRIDYSIRQLIGNSRELVVVLDRVGEFPMPIDLVVTRTDGTREVFYIPLNEMLGEKPAEDNAPRTVLAAWPWVNPSYQLVIPGDPATIKSIEIDPSLRMADIDRKNNKLEPAK